MFVSVLEGAWLVRWLTASSIWYCFIATTSDDCHNNDNVCIHWSTCVGRYNKGPVVDTQVNLPWKGFGLIASLPAETAESFALEFLACHP